MHPEWQSFLEQQGAVYQEAVVQHFGTPESESAAAMTGNILADCSDLGVLRFSGEDARNFLHNQLSNDVNALQDTESRLAAYCNPKGRALAVIRLFVLDDSFYMLLPRNIIEAVAKRLRMFVLMSKVVIDDLSDDFAVAGVAGPESAQLLSGYIGDLPTAPSAVVHAKGLSVIKLPQHESRYLLVGNVAGIKSAWQQLATETQLTGQPAWQLLDIHTGQPQVYADTVEAFVPQMLNMHAIDGVNFQKGCYPGQEIVARMYYLGKLKRRMYLAHVQQDQRPAAGDPLFASHSDSGQGAGQVVMASPAVDGGYDLLMVCPVSVIDAGPVVLGSENGPKLKVLPLPYDVPLERKAS